MCMRRAIYLAQEKYSKVVNGKNQKDKENILENNFGFFC